MANYVIILQQRLQMFLPCVCFTIFNFFQPHRNLACTSFFLPHLLSFGNTNGNYYVLPMVTISVYSQEQSCYKSFTDSGELSNCYMSQQLTCHFVIELATLFLQQVTSLIYVV